MIAGILTPYKGERDHLKLYCGRNRAPTKEDEWFKYCHSSLRNVMKHCFGILKAQFLILRDMPHGFSVKTQRYIPTACCAIHNFIRMHDPNDEVFNNFRDDEMIIQNVGPNTIVGSSSQANPHSTKRDG